MGRPPRPPGRVDRLSGVSRSRLPYSVVVICKRTSYIVAPVNGCSTCSVSRPSAFSTIAGSILLPSYCRFIPKHVEPSHFRLSFQASNILSKDKNDQREETPGGRHRL